MKWKQLLKWRHQLSLEMDRTSPERSSTARARARFPHEGGGGMILHIHERVLRALPFVARGASRASLLVYSKTAAFKKWHNTDFLLHSYTGCCAQPEIFMWEHHHGSDILAMATGHKGFPMCATRWEGVSFAGARGPARHGLCYELTGAVRGSNANAGDNERWADSTGGKDDRKARGNAPKRCLAADFGGLWGA